MSTILVPDYLKDQISDAPPGHRFQLYLGGWKPERKDGREFYKLDNKEAILPVLPLGGTAQKLLRKLRERQRALALTLEPNVLLQPAKTTSPLTTGVGIEHPSENGFAFLSPYGLPYLPGSGIKGVLRRAAEELGWSLDVIWRFFGFENVREFESGIDSSTLNAAAAEIERRDGELAQALGGGLAELLSPEGKQRRSSLQWRGALRFWDALLSPPKGTMAMEILTPHHKSYFENANTPADCEQPVPVPFLAVPADTQLDLVVECVSSRLSEQLRRTWKDLIQAAVQHAFNHVGFGAKTATGYGAMMTDEKEATIVESQRKQHADTAVRQQAERMRQEQLATMTPIERKLEGLATGMPDGERAAVWVTALQNWEMNERCAAAKEVKMRLQAMKLWRAEGNPAKDKVVKRTQQVLAILRECDPNL